MWTLQRPFYGMKNEYELVTTLLRFRKGLLKHLELPNEVPAPVCALLQDCLSADPQMRPTAKEVLARVDQLLM